MDAGEPSKRAESGPEPGKRPSPVEPDAQASPPEPEPEPQPDVHALQPQPDAHALQPEPQPPATSSGAEPPAPPSKPEPPHLSRGARAGRWVGAIALLLVGLLLAISSIAAVFVRNQILDTNRYVSTVEPLARDPLIQDAIANRLSNEILTRVDLTSLANQATSWLQSQGAPPVIDQLVGPAVSAVQSFVRTQVSNIVHSDQFEEVWDAANRTAHNAVVSIVTGETVGAVTTKGNTVSIDLGALVQTIKERLIDNGFSLASKIPNVAIPFTLFSSPDIGKIQSAVRILDDAATWLPWIALALIVAAVFAAPSHRRGIVVAGLFIAIGLLLFRGGVRLLVEYYLGRLPSTVQSPQAVERVLVTVLRNVRTAISFLALIFGLAAIFAFLAGPGRLPHGIRKIVNMLLDALGRILGASGIPLGPVPATVRQYHRVAAPVAIAIAIVVVFFNPSIGALLWSVFWVLLALAIVEIVARAAPAAEPATRAEEQPAVAS